MGQSKPVILAVGSHPDDIEFGCAGTLRKFAKKGCRVYMLIMTCGENGGEPEKRKQEALRSAKLLGVKDVFWGGLVDTKVPFYEDVIPRIEKVVKKVKPAYVFVHHRDDTHQDHRNISSSTVVATRNIQNVLFYEGPTSVDFTPNVYVDIKKELKVKMKCLECHSSQVMRTNIQGHSIVDIARATANFRGTQCRMPEAEAFKSLRMFLDI